MDRDPDQIEFEKQQQECTFRPTISNTKPGTGLIGAAQRRGGDRSPAGIGRGQAYTDQDRDGSPIGMSGGLNRRAK